MTIARYDIVAQAGNWAVRHDGEISGEYVTKESAFEPAVPVASLAVKQGFEVIIYVPPQQAGESPDGTSIENQNSST